MQCCCRDLWGCVAPSSSQTRNRHLQGFASDLHRCQPNPQGGEQPINPGWIWVQGSQPHSRRSSHTQHPEVLNCRRGCMGATLPQTQKHTHHTHPPLHTHTDPITNMLHTHHHTHMDDITHTHYHTLVITHYLTLTITHYHTYSH